MVQKCQKCNENCSLEAKDIQITPCPCFASSRLLVSFKCPHCGSENRVAESEEAHKLLDERIKNKDFDTKPSDAIDEAVCEALTERGA